MRLDMGDNIPDPPIREDRGAGRATAGVDDIGARPEQGLRFFIMTEPEALAAGKRAAGRTN